VVTFIDTFNKECTPYLTIPAQGRGESDDKKREERRTKGRRKTGGGISPSLSKESEQRSYMERTNRIKT